MNDETCEKEPITMNSQANVINYADIIAVLILCIGFIRGIIRGMSGETSSFSCWAIGIIVGFISFMPIHTLISGGSIASGWNYLSFGIALIIMICGLIAARAVFEKLQESPAKSFADHIAGSIAGFLQSLFIVIFLYVALSVAPFPAIKRLVAEESKIGRKVVICENAIMKTITDDITGVNDTIMLRREEKTSKRVMK